MPEPTLSPVALLRAHSRHAPWNARGLAAHVTALVDAAGIRPGDVIMQVNGVKVSTAADAGRELQKIPSNRLARMLLWRDPAQLFVTVKKD